MPSRKKKGRKFEKQVARWAKRFFDADEVNSPVFRRGYTQKRPYEIDVHVGIDVIEGLIFKRRRRFRDIWIECKNLKTSIKRDIVTKLVSRIEDVNKAYREGMSREDFAFDYGAIVSTTKFDIGALGYATEKDIACFQYKNGNYILQNDEVEWVEQMKFLADSR